MASTPKPWTILTALAAQLATITVANDYNTDAGLNVWTEENQRKADVLGLTVYSGDIVAASAKERPAKPARNFELIVEAQVGTDLDDASQQIHALIEDFETCMEAWIISQRSAPLTGVKPLRVESIRIDDRPEGMPVIGMQAHLTAEYFR